MAEFSRTSSREFGSSAWLILVDRGKAAFMKNYTFLLGPQYSTWSILSYLHAYSLPQTTHALKFHSKKFVFCTSMLESHIILLSNISLWSSYIESVHYLSKLDTALSSTLYARERLSNGVVTCTFVSHCMIDKYRNFCAVWIWSKELL
jgi:hypothetical protein